MNFTLVLPKINENTSASSTVFTIITGLLRGKIKKFSIKSFKNCFCKRTKVEVILQ